MADDRNARVREHAYRLWQQEGEPHGRDRDHWEQAERDIGHDGPSAEEAPAPAPSSQAEVAASAPVTADASSVSDGGASETPSPTPPAAKAAAGKSTPAKKPTTRRKRTE